MSAEGPRGGLRISAVSSMLGIPVPTIRSWERRYSFPSPARTLGKHRRYSVSEIEGLRALRDEITRGRSAREAVEFLQRASAPGGARAEALARSVVKATTHLDPIGVQYALEEAIETLGVEAAIQGVMAPAMREIGDRWKTGQCDVAEEHAATQAVRAWLARHLGTTPPPFRPRAIVLACGPKEQHSIGTEAFAVILARKGWDCRILGAQTPSDSLVKAAGNAEAGGVVVTAQRGATRRSTVVSIRAASAQTRARVFYAGSAFVATSARRGVPGTYLGDDMVEASTIVERTLAR